jgi:nuclear transcription factor Y gamma
MPGGAGGGGGGAAGKKPPAPPAAPQATPRDLSTIMDPRPVPSQVRASLRGLVERMGREAQAMGSDPHEYRAHQLPLARIKKIMKSDEDVRMISAEAPVLFSRACEAFVLDLTLRAWHHAQEQRRRTLQRVDVAAAVTRGETLDFLADLLTDDVLRQVRGEEPLPGAGGGGGGGAGPSSAAAAADAAHGHSLRPKPRRGPGVAALLASGDEEEEGEEEEEEDEEEEDEEEQEEDDEDSDEGGGGKGKRPASGKRRAGGAEDKGGGGGGGGGTRASKRSRR